jgi:predicted dithiol-disulfide oxidoreductase (DUF899 family)
MTTNTIDQPNIVSEEQWVAARKKLLAREKQVTRLRDQISQERRELPWVKVTKNYIFEGPNGRESLADLFEGRSQLIVYHFMLGPGWEQGCKSCSYLTDHFDGANFHLPHKDVTFVLTSRAPYTEIAPFHKRMGWRIKWLSSNGNSFNFDYHVSFTPEEMEKGTVHYNYTEQDFPSEEAPGLSVFYKNDAGEVFHTYSTYGRGLDALVGAYTLLDLVPKGRDEDPEATMSWVRHHDRYEDGR